MTSSDENPTVALGGVDYPVPPVAFREVSKILPLVSKVFSGMRSGELNEEMLDGLGKIIYYGIKRGQPGLSYDDFIDRPATTAEMMAAALVVCRQAGLKVKEPKLGEAKGETPPPTSTS